MPPARSELDWPAVADTIDLTGSPSPEPPPRRHPTAAPRPSAPTPYPRYAPVTNASYYAPRPTPITAPASSRPPKRIRPEHMARIIDTSPPDAIRTVLLELCNFSPALCGAVARGLMPHSTFARSLTRPDPGFRYAQTPDSFHLKPDPEWARAYAESGPSTVKSEHNHVPDASTYSDDDSDSDGLSLLSAPDISEIWSSAGKRKRESSPTAPDDIHRLSESFPRSYGFSDRHTPSMPELHPDRLHAGTTTSSGRPEFPGSNYPSQRFGSPSRSRTPLQNVLPGAAGAAVNRLAPTHTYPAPPFTK